MPKNRPPTSGYARIAQAEEEQGFRNGYFDESDDDDDNSGNHRRTISQSTTGNQYDPTQPRRNSMRVPDVNTTGEQRSRRGNGMRPRLRSNSSGVDIKAINARLERWAEEIAAKFKIRKVKGKSDREENLEIHYSVFQAPEGVRPLTANSLEWEQPGKFTKAQFEDTVESVRWAIEQNIHPKMISQGSSGSYFARNSNGKTVGVFKPKDEEPYANGNPKWTKWLHRNLFPCFFGRACLIPNLSYVSEAAAYVLDTQLRTNLVPYTDIVWLSSKSFHYDFWDRRKFYRNHKPFPAKVGSFQVFLTGFKDANIFLREHPWPDQPNYNTVNSRRKKQRSWSEQCRTNGTLEEEDEEEQERLQSAQPSPAPEDPRNRRFAWTEALQQSLREELEKLVILDYIMRNTDRGLDNWMIKVDWVTQTASIVSEPIRQGLNGVAEEDDTPPIRPVGTSPHLQPYQSQQPMAATSRTASPANGEEPTMVIGAIDNSLSWPWKHPDAVSSSAP
jgi:phosphatidylinositol 4-kinase type 2